MHSFNALQIADMFQNDTIDDFLNSFAGGLVGGGVRVGNDAGSVVELIILTSSFRLVILLTTVHLG